METDQPTEGEIPQMTPPVMGRDLGEQPAKWPKVVGVINIVLASLGLICYGCGSLNTILSPFFVGMIPEGQRPVTAQGAQLAIQIVQQCVATALSVWLLIAGIGLVKRRAWARAHCIGWSVVKIILALLSTLMGALFAQQIVQQINDQLSQRGTPPFTLTVPIVMTVIIVSLFVYLIWPTFMLIWFTREKITHEMAEWAAEDAGVI
jgi:hypothetical protein